MKKTREKRSNSARVLILTFVFATFAMTTYGQFQQRVTINGSIGFAMPAGATEYYIDDWGDYEAYIFSNFAPGLGISGGIQYNLNQRFSIEGKIYSLYLWDWTWDNDTWGWYDDAYFDFFHLSLGAVPKFYILPGKKINPFAFAEVNLSFNDIIADYDDGWGRDQDEVLESAIALGTFLGAGADVNISPNLGLFVQGGYYITFLGAYMEDNWGTGEDSWENFEAVRIEAGLKISLFKSKQL